jgi:hypothetical protein
VLAHRRPPDHSRENRDQVNASFEQNSLPYRVTDDGDTVRSTLPVAQERPASSGPVDEPDAVMRARSRLDRMRGIH